MSQRQVIWAFLWSVIKFFVKFLCIIQLGKVMKYQLDTINVKYVFEIFFDLSEQKIRVNHLTLCLTIISSWGVPHPALSTSNLSICCSLLIEVMALYRKGALQFSICSLSLSFCFLWHTNGLTYFNWSLTKYSISRDLTNNRISPEEVESNWSESHSWFSETLGLQQNPNLHLFLFYIVVSKPFGMK